MHYSIGLNTVSIKLLLWRVYATLNHVKNILFMKYLCKIEILFNANLSMVQEFLWMQSVIEYNMFSFFYSVMLMKNSNNIYWKIVPS